MAGNFKNFIKSLGLFIGKIDHWVGIAISIPILGSIIETLLKKGGEKAKEKVSDVLGLSKDDSGKGLGDEIGYTWAERELSIPQRQDLAAFEKDLGDDENYGEKYLIALHVFIAKLVTARSKKVTNTRSSGKNGPRRTTEHEEYDIQTGKEFLLTLLSFNSYEDRVKYLKNRGVFTTVKKNKGSNQAEETAKKVYDETKKKASSWLDRQKIKSEQRLENSRRAYEETCRRRTK